MRYLGEEKTVEVVTKSIRPVEYIRCEKCGKKILPCKSKNKESSYIRIHTWHHDWGSESIESHKYGDYCKECAKDFIAEYITNARGTEKLKIEHEYLMENETYEDYIEEEYDARLVEDDEL